MRNAAGQHLPAWAGGQTTKQGETPAARRDGESRTGGRLRNAANAGRRGRAAGAAPEARVPGRGRHGPARRPRSGGRAAARRARRRTRGRTRHRRPRRRRLRGAALQTGCRRRASPVASRTSPTSCSRRGCRARTSPVSVRAGPGGAAQPARRTRGAASASSSPTTAPGRASTSPTRRMGEWTPDEREALRTLAAASPDVRAAAIHDVLGDGDHATRVPMTAGARATRACTSSPAAGPSTPGQSRRHGRPSARRRERAGHDGTAVRSGATARTAAGREGARAAPREPRASDPDTRFPGGQGGST